MRKFILFFVAIAAFPAHANEAEPLLSLTVRNGADLPELLKRNPWLERLRATNLYEGLTLRFLPILGALPGEKQTTWKGRLADAVAELALRNRPVSIDYYRASGLVQPLGASVQGLSAVEQKGLEALLESLRAAADQPVDGEEQKMTVSPVEVSGQRLAVKLGDRCLGVSRDPRAALWSWKRCKALKAPESDAELAVHLPSLAGATEKALQGFLGVQPVARVSLEKSGDSSLTVKSANVALAAGHVLKNAALSALPLGALPASTNFLVSTVVPLPAKLDADELKSFLAKDSAAWKQGKRVTVTYFHLGSTHVENQGVQAESGLLIEAGEGHGEQAWAPLFEPRHGREVYVKDVCQKKLTLVTPSQAVLEKVNEACDGKVPTLAQAPSGMKAQLSMESGAQALLVNFGKALSGMMDLGWELENKGKPRPPEVEEARKVLASLPALVLGGKVEKSTIHYEAKSWEF